MKQKLKIYTNIKNYNFFEQIIPNYKLIFKLISDLDSDPKDNERCIMLYIKTGETDNLIPSNISKNILLITNDEKNFNSINKNIIVLKKQASPQKIKNYIEYFINNNINVGDIAIIEKKLINTKTNNFCYLTEIESEILTYLIKNQNPSKDLIKINILNIRLNIETNSLDSHLTRIRKKLDKIGSNLVIQSKNDSIVIFTHQKTLD
ncbi:helix-turn-helix domain-containing protein [Pelagibacteraceae bacterium]|nr:helix-turn-helix domain-containing protein [Pelagibacteraceae bacterium]